MLWVALLAWWPRWLNPCSWCLPGAQQPLRQSTTAFCKGFHCRGGGEGGSRALVALAGKMQWRAAGARSWAGRVRTCPVVGAVVGSRCKVSLWWHDRHDILLRYLSPLLRLCMLAGYGTQAVPVRLQAGLVWAEAPNPKVNKVRGYSLSPSLAPSRSLSLSAFLNGQCAGFCIYQGPFGEP